MSREFKLPLLIALVFFINVIIYLREIYAIEGIEGGIDWIFGECARNSGRISAALNLSILLLLGFYGLKNIYKEDKKKNAFRILVSLFTINHLIHFFFVYQNFKSQMMVLDISHNLHGFITFCCILILPIILWSFNKLNKLLYFGIILHLFNVTYFMIISFYGRIKPVDPAYLHRLGISVMIGALLYVLYGVYRERTIDLLKVD